MILSLIIVGSVVLVGLIALAVAMTWRTVVAPSKVHVVQRRKSSTAYGRDYDAGNVYYAIPSFIPYWGIKSVVIPIDVFDLDLAGYEAYDAAKVPFSVDIKAFFQIEDSIEAAKRINSYEELRGQLSDVIRGAVRKILASYPVENIMVNRKTLGEEFQTEVVQHVKAWGVKVVNLEFMNITDSPDSRVIKDIQARETSTINKESRIRVAENQQLAQVSEIAARQTIELRDVEKNLAVQVRTQETEQLIKEQMKETAERQKAIEKVEAVRAQEIEKERQIVAAEAEREVIQIDAEAKAEAARREAEGYKDAQTSQGQGEASKIAATGKSEAEVVRMKALAEAEGKEKMAEALQKYNAEAQTIERLHIDKEIQVAKWGAYGMVAQNAEIKIVQSGRGLDVLGLPVNAESGADIDMFLKQLNISKEDVEKLPSDIVEKVKQTIRKNAEDTPESQQ